MAGRRPIIGDRPPAYCSKATLAAELDVSESTVDAWVQRGLLPMPVRVGGCVRWSWAEVHASLAAIGGAPEADPFLEGLRNVS